MTRDRIEVDVPASDARRDRVEQQVFQRLDAIRAGERAESTMPTARVGGHRRQWIALAVGATALAITIAVIVRPTAPAIEAPEPSRVVTPIGGGSRFTIGDAVIDAGSDTSVEVSSVSSGIALVLSRGTIDCDVEHRPDRAPFRVIAGDVTVEVIGTRFAVTRIASGARVDVTRGKVRVTSPSGNRFVAAGETWSSGPEITATASPSQPAQPPAPIAVPPPAVPPIGAPPPPTTPPAPSPQAAFESAKRLLATDPVAGARGLRKVAAGSTKWAALALFDLAELEVERGQTKASLADLAEYTRRFPRGANAEDVAWLRVEALMSSRQQDAARTAASDYLARFPAGTYAKPAQRLIGANR